MQLSDLFVQTKPREISGSRTSSRYDYQKDWAIGLLLECHEEELDYAICIDYHDDVVLLNSSTNPTKLSFFQIKTKSSGCWTANALLSRKQNKKKQGHSILGALVLNKVRFPDHTESVNLVTNALFDLRLLVEPPKSKEKRKILGIELSEKIKGNFKKKLLVELTINEEVLKGYESSLQFLVTDLSLDGHQDHTKGKLETFLNSKFPNSSLRISLFYKTIFDEIKRKCNHSVESANFEECIKKKAITRPQFESMIQSCSINNTFVTDWSSIEQALRTEKLPEMEIKTIRDEWRNLEVNLLNSEDQIIQSLKSIISQIYDTEKQKFSTMNLIQIMDHVFSIYNNAPNNAINWYPIHFIKAIILLKHYE